MSQLMDALSDPYFKPTKQLTIKDEVFISMLECCQNKGPCYVITDPSLRGDSLLFQLFDVSPVKWFSFLSYLFPDNPIIYASKGFTQYTGYAKEEVEGRNCRFLQGKDTCPLDISRIRKAIANKEEVSVCLLNYRKNGTTFLNQVKKNLALHWFHLIVMKPCHLICSNFIILWTVFPHAFVWRWWTSCLLHRCTSSSWE